MQALSIMYHDVVENGDWESSGFPGQGARVYKLDAVEFRRHLDAIQSAAGNRPVTLTFDDGGASSNRIAAMLEEHGYTLTEPRTLEADQLFDRARELRDSDQLLRLRQTKGRGADRAMVTYKGPGAKGIHKSREEIEFDVSDPEAFTLVLERLGYYPSFRYEKYRTKFASAGEPGFITIDETPIGIYLELEGAPEWIDQTAARLGYPPAKYLICSYASLYKEYRLAHQGAPENMTFARDGSM